MNQVKVWPINEARLQEDGTKLFVQGVIDNVLRCGPMTAKKSGHRWIQTAFILKDQTGNILVEVNEPAFTPTIGQHVQVDGKANVYPGYNKKTEEKEWKITLKATALGFVLVRPAEGVSSEQHQTPTLSDEPTGQAPASFGSAPRVAGGPVASNIPDGPQQRVKPVARQRGEYERLKATQALAFQQALVSEWHDWCEHRELHFHDEALAALVNTVMIQYLRGNLVDDLTDSSAVGSSGEQPSAHTPVPNPSPTPSRASQPPSEGSQVEPPWATEALGPQPEPEFK